jgi:hypothetical protein
MFSSNPFSSVERLISRFKRNAGSLIAPKSRVDLTDEIERISKRIDEEAEHARATVCCKSDPSHDMRMVERPITQPVTTQVSIRKPD